MKISIQFFGGRGSGGGKRSGGGGGSSESSGKPVTESSLRKLASSGNINIDAPKVEEALQNSPVGTKLVFDAYYSRAGQMQSTFTKISQNEWEESWGVRNGKTFWTTKDNTRRTSQSIFNAIYGN